jgi:hypothetical protein
LYTELGAHDDEEMPDDEASKQPGSVVVA